jgi:hypothetical protein
MRSLPVVLAVLQKFASVVILAGIIEVKKWQLFHFKSFNEAQGGKPSAPNQAWRCS